MIAPLGGCPVAFRKFWVSVVFSVAVSVSARVCLGSAFRGCLCALRLIFGSCRVACLSLAR